MQRRWQSCTCDSRARGRKPASRNTRTRTLERDKGNRLIKIRPKGQWVDKAFNPDHFPGGWESFLMPQGFSGNCELDGMQNKYNFNLSVVSGAHWCPINWREPGGACLIARRSAIPKHSCYTRQGSEAWRLDLWGKHAGQYSLFWWQKCFWWAFQGLLMSKVITERHRAVLTRLYKH